VIFVCFQTNPKKRAFAEGNSIKNKEADSMCPFKFDIHNTFLFSKVQCSNTEVEAFTR